MHHPQALTYYRGRWPDAEVPADEATWLLYEVSPSQDAVLRSVDIYADGRVTRNSVELEQQNGDHCPSLIECSVEEAFPDTVVTVITQQEFEDAWARGVDKPFWFTR